MIGEAIGEWQRLSFLYEEAVELEGVALDAWLADREREGHPLLASVRRMLAARGRAAGSGFLEALPTLSGDADARWQSNEGRRIGPYRLTRFLGAGGSADVWLAERADGVFERRVAVKLLHRQTGDKSPGAFAERFRRERHFLAALDHPNIARLHDAGVTDEGQPWIALEFVEGEAITGWCDRRAMDVRNRTTVFLQVLRAVEHAHANLVLHRDIKPGNIFVTDPGEARLLDFGIAKLISEDGSVSDTELTQESGRPLTLQYASPEQLLGGALSTRTDVYALGVVLYELVAGVRPYDLKLDSAAQIEQAILRLDPRAPSRREIPTAAALARGTTARDLRRLLARDLDAIVLRCLAKDPEQRYSSVESLRKDIERWQRGEPVEARRPTPWYRARRFVARHALPVSLAAIAFAGILVATATAVWMGFDARQESARAVVARDFLLDIYLLTDPDRAPNGSMETRRLLEGGARKALDTLAGQPLLQAQVLTSIGQLQTNLSDYRAAERNLAFAEQRYRMAGERRGWVEVQAERARNAYFMGDEKTARALIEAASAAAGDFASDLPLQFKILDVRGRVRTQQADRVAARADLQQGLELARRLYTDADVRTIDLVRALAALESDMQDFAGARALLAQAAESAAKLQQPGARVRIGVDFDRSLLEFNTGRYADAAALLADLGPRCEANLGPDIEDCVVTRTLKTIVALRLGDRPGAAESLDALLRDADNDASPRRQIESLIQAGRVLAFTGLPDVRRRVSERLERLVDNPEQSPLYRCAALLALVENSLSRGDPAAAEKWARQAIEIQRVSASPSMAWIGRGTVMLAVALWRQDRGAEAAAAFDSADRILVESLGADHPLAHLLRLNAAPLWRHDGDGPRAAAACNAARGRLRQALGPVAPVMSTIAALCGDRPTGSDPSRREEADFLT